MVLSGTLGMSINGHLMLYSCLPLLSSLPLSAMHGAHGIRIRNEFLILFPSLFLSSVAVSESPMSDLQKLAMRGNIEAQLILGTKYHYGEGVLRDEARAFKWYLKAANQGDSRAQSNIGLMYATGEGVGQDDGRAAEWYLKAAKQGNVNAQFNLGTMYDTGRGIHQSYTEAAKWFLKAAKQRDTESQFNLSLMYLRGEGVKKDHVQAYKWVYLAEMHAEDGDAEIYRNARKTIIDTMTPEEIIEAESLVEDWLSEMRQ